MAMLDRLLIMDLLLATAPRGLTQHSGVRCAKPKREHDLCHISALGSCLLPVRYIQLILIDFNEIVDRM
jgi:hypothetical protein